MTIDLDKGWLEEAFESGIAWIVIGLIIAAAGITTAVFVRRKIIKKRVKRKLNIPPELE